MKIQRKWRRAWQRGKPHWALYRPVKRQRQAVKNNVIRMASRVAKKLLPPVAAASILFSTLTGAYASPTGGQVVSGAGSIAQNGNTTNITQTTGKMSVNWQSFNIAANEKVNFQQPGANSVALNRVIGNNASSIYGQLTANGKVFLINPNGVLFAKGAEVNVGGLVASTLNLSDQDFQNGKYNFTGKGGSVINQGTIQADGGCVALLGGQVVNQGVIVANKGTVALAAGNAVTLDMDGDGMLSLAVNQSAVNALSENKNLIEADGGKVIMTARAADKLAGTAVNNSGVIQAKSIATKNGVIILDGGEKGTVQVSGTLDASGKAAGETGGTIKVLGNTINVVSATLNASGDQGGGTILVGGNYQGSGTEQHAASTTVAADAALSADALTAGNGGKVVVWSDKTTGFNGNISAKGGTTSGNGGTVETSGKQSLKVGDTASVTTAAVSGKNGNWLLDPANFTIGGTNGDISVSILDAALASSDVTITTGDSVSTATKTSDNSTLATGTGGTDGDITVAEALAWDSSKTLTLSARRYININAPITAVNGGLSINSQQHQYVSDNNYDISATGAVNVGTFILEFGKWKQHASSLPSFSAKDFQIYPNSSFLRVLGGDGSTTTPYQITDVYGLQGIGSGTAAGGSFVLANNIDASGTAVWNSGAGFKPHNVYSIVFDGGNHTISHLTVNRPAEDFGVGLFATANYNVTIKNVGLTDVQLTGRGLVGGLLGKSLLGSTVISNCYVTGFIKGENWVGGLVGRAGDGGSCTISNSYSAAVINADDQAGGLAGLCGSTTISNSYSISAINGSGNNIGGLVGREFSGNTITDSYWDSSTSGQAGGQSTAEMMKAVNFTGWDFSNTGPWRIIEGVSYPYLSWQFGASTPQIVSGTVNVAGSGRTVQVAVNNSSLPFTTNTYNNGFYYFTLPANSVTDNSYILTYISGDSVKANAVYFNGTGGSNVTGLDLNANTVTVSSASSLASNQTLGSAHGNLTSGDILYNVSENNLTLNNNVSFQTKAGTAYSLDGHITTQGTGKQIYNGPVTLNGNRTLTTGNGVIFADTVTGNGNSLTVANSGGNAEFGGSVSAVSSLTVEGDTALKGDVTTSGSQHYKGVVTLNGDRTLTTGSGVIFAGTVTGNGNSLTVAKLTAGGNAEFDGSVTAVSLTIEGDTALKGDVATSGSQNYKGAVTLSGSGLTLTSSNASGSVTFGKTLDGAAALIIDGEAVFSDVVGNTTPLASLTVNHDTTAIGVGITTSGSQTYNGAVTLTADVGLKSTDGAVTFGGTVDGSHALTVATGKDSVIFSGDVGSSAPLSVLTVNSAGGFTVNHALKTTGNVLLQTGGDMTITSGGSIESGGENVNLVLNGGSFTDSHATGGIHTDSGKKYLLYLNDPSKLKELSGLDYDFTQYNTSYSAVTGGTASIAGAGNGIIYADSLNIWITTNPLTKVYDGTNEATGLLQNASYTSVAKSGGNVVNVLNEFSINGAVTATFGTVDVGDTTVTLHGDVLFANVRDSNSKPIYGYATTSSTTLTGHISARPITLSTVSAGKTYGQTDSELSVKVGDGSSLATTDSLAEVTGTVGRESGENAGSYDIALGSGAKTKNYNITFTGDNNAFTINPAVLTITPDSQSKTYGASDNSLSYTATGLVNGVLGISDTQDTVLTGTLVRIAGEDVRPSGQGYDIHQGSLAVKPNAAGAYNYTLSLADNGAKLTITPAALTVTASSQSKTYGASDSLTYATAGLVNGVLGINDTQDSVFTGTLGRAAGEDVRPSGQGYDINQGSLAVKPNAAGAYNYTLSLADNGAKLTITPAALTVTASSQSKTYGASDSLTYATAGLVNGVLGIGDTQDTVFTGTLGRAAGEDVRPSGQGYDINQGSLAVKSNAAGAYNYTLSLADNGAKLTITPAALTVTASLQSKTYGTSDSLTYATAGLVNGVLGINDTQDSILTGTLGRAAGEDVRPSGQGYDINQGSLAVKPNAAGAYNYTLAYQGSEAKLSITPAALTVTASSQSKTYGASDSLTYTIAGLVNGVLGINDTQDSVFTGTLGRAAGEDVRPSGQGYDINQGSLAVKPNAAGACNYTLAYQGSGAKLTITPAALTVTASSQSKTYGTSDSLTYTTAGLVNGVLGIGDTQDTVFTGTLGRAAGEDVRPSGQGYDIHQGSLAVKPNAAGACNYTLAYQGSGAKLDITPAALTVTASSQSKTYGTSDSLTYTTAGLVNGVLGIGDTQDTVLTGTLGRAAGEDVRPSGQGYDIHQGSLAVKSNAAGAYNYTLSLANNGAKLTITPAALTVTASSQSKTYGTSDSLTYTTAGLVNGVLGIGDTQDTVLTGTLGRAAGEDVRPSGQGYDIHQGSLAVKPNAAGACNYTLAYQGSGAKLDITPAALTVTASSQSKTYGASDSLTYATAGLVNGVLGIGDTQDTVLTGILGRAAGEDVRPSGQGYDINQGSLAVKPNAAGAYNYTLSLADNGAKLAITPAALTVTASSQSKTYGASDSLTYATAGLVNGVLGINDTQDTVLTGTIGRAAGEDVRLSGQGYDINQGSLAVKPNAAGAYNYTLSLADNGAKLTITPAALTVTASSQSKTYGTSDSLTYATAGLVNGVLGINDTQDSILTGTLGRAAGEDVRPSGQGYDINQGSLAVKPNAAGAYNYTLAYQGSEAKLSITPAALTVTASSQSKTYGASDSLTYTTTGLVNGVWGINDTQDSVFTGTLGRAAGEDVRPSGQGYDINQGSLAVKPNAAGAYNYTLAYQGSGAKLTITPAALTVTAISQSKTYGASDSLTYTTTGLVNGVLGISDTQDSVLTGTLGRTAGEDVRPSVQGYDINQGSLAVKPNAAGAYNYTIAYQGSGAKLDITPAALTVTAISQSKTYGASDSLTYTTTGLVNGVLGINDTQDSILTGTLGRAAGEDVRPSGQGYDINQGSLAIRQNAMGGYNYTLDYRSGAKLTINPAVLTVTANPLSKMYGTSDPTLAYSVNGLMFHDHADGVLNGSLTRMAGETVAGGPYAITQGTLVANSNYTINYTGNFLAITPAMLSVTAAAQSKVYGASDPALTYSVSGFVLGDHADGVLSGSLTRTAGETVAGGPYAVTQGTLTANSNYTINYTGNSLAITPAMLSVTAAAQSKVYGVSDPALTYSVSGFVLGDTAGSVINGTLSRTAGETVTGGPYAITQGTLAANSNYTINYTGNSLTITSATLTIRAHDAIRWSNFDNPVLTYTQTGLASTDAISDVISGFILTTTATRASQVGTYDITPSGKLISSNYTVNWVPGTLTVTVGEPYYGAVIYADKMTDHGYRDRQINWQLPGCQTAQGTVWRPGSTPDVLSIVSPGVNLDGIKRLTLDSQQ